MAQEVQAVLPLAAPGKAPTKALGRKPPQSMGLSEHHTSSSTTEHLAEFVQSPAADLDQRETVQTQRWYYYKGHVKSAEKWTTHNCLFSASAHPQLAKEIGERLGVALSNASLTRFKDSEVSIEVNETVRGRDVFVVQSVCRSYPNQSVNDALMELTLFVGALRRSSAKSVTAVLPYYGYSRSDRRMGRYTIGAADVAHILTSVGVDRVMAVDLHSGQIQGFFPPHVPVDNLPAGSVAACYFAELGLDEAVVASPDAGGVARAKQFASTMTTVGLKLRMKGLHPEKTPGTCVPNAGYHKLAILVKQRSGASQIERMDLIGNVADEDVILVDDIVDTAGTLCTAAAECKRHGARRVFAFCTHGLFSGCAPRRLAEAYAAGHLEYVVVTNSVPQLPWPEWEAACGGLPPPPIKVLSIAAMLAEAIKRVVCSERLNLTDMADHVVEAVSKL